MNTKKNARRALWQARLLPGADSLECFETGGSFLMLLNRRPELRIAISRLDIMWRPVYELYRKYTRVTPYENLIYDLVYGGRSFPGFPGSNKDVKDREPCDPLSFFQKYILQGKNKYLGTLAGVCGFDRKVFGTKPFDDGLFEKQFGRAYLFYLRNVSQRTLSPKDESLIADTIAGKLNYRETLLLSHLYGFDGREALGAELLARKLKRERSWVCKKWLSVLTKLRETELIGLFSWEKACEVTFKALSIRAEMAYDAIEFSAKRLGVETKTLSDEFLDHYAKILEERGDALYKMIPHLSLIEPV